VTTHYMNGVERGCQYALMEIGERTSLTEPNHCRDERYNPVIPVHLPYNFLVRSHCKVRVVASSHEWVVGDISIRKSSEGQGWIIETSRGSQSSRYPHDLRIASRRVISVTRQG